MFFMERSREQEKPPVGYRPIDDGTIDDRPIDDR